VLRLGKEVRGCEARIRLPIRYHHRFRGPGQALYADRAEHGALGEDHEEVSRTCDLVHARNALRAVGHGGDRLRAAKGEHTVHASNGCRRQHDIGHPPIRILRRRADHDLLHAGHARRNGRHEERGWKRRATRRRIQTHPLQGDDDLAERALDVEIDP
jgi:hypothetical protein